MASFLRKAAPASVLGLSLALACSDGGGGALDGPGSGGADANGSGGTSAAGGFASASGGTLMSSGGLGEPGAGGTSSAPVDCSGITAAGFELCNSTNDSCGAVYDDSSGCAAVCAAAGLGCSGAFENAEGVCAADGTLPALPCDSGHQSDYCTCSGALLGSGGTSGSGGAAATGGTTSTGGASGSGGSSGGSSSGGASTGGSGGTNAWPVTGFASTSGNGLTTTTGGGSLAPLTVSSCDALATALSDDTARVIRIAPGTTLDCRTSGTLQACELQCSNAAATPVFWRAPVTGQTCTTLADFNGDGALDVPAGKLVTRPATDRGMKIGSNKTLYGAGAGATILGVSFDIANESNIIIRNLTISEVNPSIVEAGDGVTVNTSHHVWIDHCRLSMISDGYSDIRYGSSAVTLSYNHIVGKNSYVCGGKHNYISLVDASDVTFHHNYFDNSNGRNPKVTSTSRVHIYSNYYLGVGYFCANAGTGSQVLVQSNLYKDSRYPHWKDGGQIEASGNSYTGTTSADHRDGGDNVFDPPYTYALDSVGGLGTTIPNLAGPHDIGL